MPLPSSHLRVSSRTPLGGERNRGRSRHSRDDRGRGGGGDWAEERSRGDRDRGYDRNRRHEREGRGQAREMERERHRERRAREADREPGEITTSSSRMEDGELASQGRQPLATDSASSISPQKKRKISPIVWDLDDSKPGAAAAASLLTSRFGPSGSPRSQQRSSCSSSPLKQSPSEQGKSREKSGVSPLDGKQASVNGAPVETTRMFISPPSGRGTDPSHGTPVASRLSSLSYEDESGDVRMQDVRRVTGTPDSEDGLEPGQVLDSPMKQEEDSTPAPATIARSRWAEDPATPEHESLPSLCKARSRSNESEELHGKAASTSPEPGVFRNETCSHEDGDEEYERSEDSGSEDRELESEPEENYPGVPGGSPSQHRAIDMLQGCRSVNEFERLNKINEGTYGVVFRARDKKTGELVALKQLKMENEKRGFPMTSLREINVLLAIHHPSIVDVKEVVVGKTVDDIFMVMEYMEHDLKGLMDSMKQPFSQSEVKCLMLQLFDGVKYLHDNWVLHRDLKTSNLLLNNRGELKICDLGLARQYGDPLKEYTHEVVTLWYRAPELLLGARKYSTPIDMWSLGCIMAEFLAKEPLFPGKSPIDEIDKIFKTLGTPNEKIWPDFVKFSGGRYNFTQQPFNRLRKKFPPTAFSSGPTLSNKGFDLLNRLLTYDPSKRITADEALDHEWFREVPLPKAKEFLPTFPARRVR